METSCPEQGIKARTGARNTDFSVISACAFNSREADLLIHICQHITRERTVYQLGFQTLLNSEGMLQWDTPHRLCHSEEGRKKDKGTVFLLCVSEKFGGDVMGRKLLFETEDTWEMGRN